MMLFRNHFPFVESVYAQFLKGGLKIVEMPVNHRGRLAGDSKYTNFNRAIRGVYDLFGVKWLLNRKVSFDISERNEPPTDP